MSATFFMIRLISLYNSNSQNLSAYFFVATHHGEQDLQTTAAQGEQFLWTQAESAGCLFSLLAGSACILCPAVDHLSPILAASFPLQSSCWAEWILCLQGWHWADDVTETGWSAFGLTDCTSDMLEAEDLAEKTVWEERLPVSESSADSSLDFVTGSSSSSPVLFSFADGLSNRLTTPRQRLSP